MKKKEAVRDPGLLGKPANWLVATRRRAAITKILATTRTRLRKGRRRRRNEMLLTPCMGMERQGSFSSIPVVSIVFLHILLGSLEDEKILPD